MLDDLLASLEANRVINEIKNEWRQRVYSVIFNNDRYKNVEFVESLIAIADEALNAQVKIHQEFAGKIAALLELEERKKLGDNATAIN